jgi:hypothetical protein
MITEDPRFHVAQILRDHGQRPGLACSFLASHTCKRARAVVQLTAMATCAALSDTL